VDFLAGHISPKELGFAWWKIQMDVAQVIFFDSFCDNFFGGKRERGVSKFQNSGKTKNVNPHTSLMVHS
jgi:hypothetical protein